MSNLISTTPLLTSLRQKGSTFYTFSTTLNDMSRVLAGGLKWAPTKFACLKLPEWSNLSGVQKMFRDSADFGPTITTDPNTLIPKMMQNYIENQLQYSNSYANGSSYLNWAESAWWKMMKTLGALDLKVDRTVTELGDDYPVFVEDDSVLTGYDKMVKYVGDITMINSIANAGRAYTEVYAYIPTDAGLVTPITWFKRNMTHSLTAVPEDPGPLNSVGLDAYPNSQIQAIYDTVDNKYSVGGEEDEIGLWFDDISSNPANYKNGNFDFNCILLYYDIWPETDPSRRARNLYGVLFLDRFEDVGSSRYAIDAYKKYQPDQSTDGNAFGFRFNLIYSNASNQVVAQTAINDYDTVSMQLYLSALEKLNKVSDAYQTGVNDLVTLKNQMNAIMSKLNTIPVLDDLVAKVNTIEKKTNLLNQTYRVSNEELFAMFDNAVTQAKESGNISINMPVGNYIWDGDDVYIYSPDGVKWIWQINTWVVAP